MKRSREPAKSRSAALSGEEDRQRTQGDEGGWDSGFEEQKIRFPFRAEHTARIGKKKIEMKLVEPFQSACESPEF